MKMVRAEQLLLNLRPRTEARLADFAGPAYAGLKSAAGHLLAGDEPLLYVKGEAGSGRSHFLAALCAAAVEQGLPAILLPLSELRDHSPDMLDGLESQALIACDDVDALAGHRSWEEALFHLFNRCRSKGGRLAFTAVTAPAQAGFSLPDLVSRLSLAPCWSLELPDDDSRRALLEMAAGRRGMVLDETVLDWMIRRAPRQPAALLAWLEQADRLSLAQGRRLTVPFLSQLPGLAAGSGSRP